MSDFPNVLRPDELRLWVATHILAGVMAHGITEGGPDLDRILKLADALIAKNDPRKRKRQGET